MDSEEFLLGVNYWPRKKAMTWWNHFDVKEVENDFQTIQDLGLSLVRIFLLWESFQPESPDRVAAKAVEHVCTVANAAAKYGLKLDVTFFTGHMSGPNWCP
eukprot:CAMPEP_0119126664 /NCGR_PEP_ID=MMETSP1310-20130426/5502_1 /TAXON_ID=464262 /ORGANISM="Genus nov. species nov., Strain RCC2339" /LENGTH=100 /DNA_ID=CAMNT_0007116835 /DNA_START=137 /DNA_END=435 /DNA_ORIENTATION=+